MGSASAVLGPLCDGQHSSHDVLHYADPARLALGPLQLETCWCANGRSHRASQRTVVHKVHRTCHSTGHGAAL